MARGVRTIRTITSDGFKTSPQRSRDSDEGPSVVLQLRQLESIPASRRRSPTVDSACSRIGSGSPIVLYDLTTTRWAAEVCAYALEPEMNNADSATTSPSKKAEQQPQACPQWGVDGDIAVSRLYSVVAWLKVMAELLAPSYSESLRKRKRKNATRNPLSNKNGSFRRQPKIVETIARLQKHQ